MVFAQIAIQGRRFDDDFLLGQGGGQLLDGKAQFLHLRQLGSHEEDGLAQGKFPLHGWVKAVRTKPAEIVKGALNMLRGERHGYSLSASLEAVAVDSGFFG